MFIVAKRLDQLPFGTKVRLASARVTLCLMQTQLQPSPNVEQGPQFSAHVCKSVVAKRMDQDATWYKEGGLGPGHCVTWGSSFPP